MEKFIAVLIAIALFAGIFLVIGWAFETIWNFVMPALSVGTLTFWQAVGMVALLGFVGGFIKSGESS